MKNIKLSKYVKLIIILGIVSFTIAFAFGLRTQKTSIPVDFLIDNVTGFNVDTDAVHLGAITPGSAGSRNITLRGADAQSIIYIYSRGRVSKYLLISERLFTLGPHVEKQITIVANIPASEGYGNYTGTLEVRQIIL